MKTSLLNNYLFITNTFQNNIGLEILYNLKIYTYKYILQQSNLRYFHDTNNLCEFTTCEPKLKGDFLLKNRV